MTTGREIARGDKGAKVVHQERCSSRGSVRIKSGGMGEANPPALRSSGSKRPTSPRMEREIGSKQRDGSSAPPTVDELLKTVKRLEKGFLSLADAVIAEIEGMREDARCWQEEREELWKIVMAFHSHQKSDMEPFHHRLDSLEKRTNDIEKHLQSRGPDTRVLANDRLEELERRACELEKQVKKQHAHFLYGPHQIGPEKPEFKEELVYRGSPLEQHRNKLEGSKRLGLSSRNCDPEETILAVRKEIEEFHGGRVSHGRISGELQSTELQYYLSAFTHGMHKLQVWCKIFENDQTMRLQRPTESVTEEHCRYVHLGLEVKTVSRGCFPIVRLNSDACRKDNQLRFTSGY